MKNRILLLFAIFFTLGCTEKTMSESRKGNTMNYSEATFAGGCFWCMEPPFEQENGVISVTSGYTGGPEKNPTYQQVSSGITGHVEAVKIVFDPKLISYEKLLDIFWRSIDPTDKGGQFADRGTQYHTAIFYHSEEQRKLALTSKKMLEASKKFDKPIVTPLLPAGAFYNAEEYHQDYYKKNYDHYKQYKIGSGREGFLDLTWDDTSMPSTQPAGNSMLSKAERLKQLTKEQYSVTQENGTEPAFKNEYWDNKKPGIYVDIVSGEPLFSSTHKYKSGTGWPSYYQPLEKENVVEVVDKSYGMTRIEVRSKNGDSHLGHLFNDGPKPTGQRYCINSASLRFIPSEDLEKEGYGKYSALFKM